MCRIRSAFNHIAGDGEVDAKMEILCSQSWVIQHENTHYGGAGNNIRIKKETKETTKSLIFTQ